MPEALSDKTKHSVVIAGHATSITLEPEFWAQLKRIAKLRALSLAGLIAEIDEARLKAAQANHSSAPRNLSAALRVYVLDFVLHAQSR